MHGIGKCFNSIFTVTCVSHISAYERVCPYILDVIWSYCLVVGIYGTLSYNDDVQPLLVSPVLDSKEKQNENSTGKLCFNFYKYPGPVLDEHGCQWIVVGLLAKYWGSDSKVVGSSATTVVSFFCVITATI